MLRSLLSALAFTCVLTPCNGVASDQNSLLKRGTYLVEGIVACGNCHTPKSADAVPIQGMQFAGGFVIKEPGVKAYAPNITMDKETGIGAWSDAEIIRAIREGLRPDGTIIGPPMPNIFYRGMSDRDAQAIVTYLRTVKPVKHTVQKSSYDFPLPAAWGPPVGHVPEVSREDPVVYGGYLTHVLGHCTECHTPRVKGVHDFSRIGAGGTPLNGIFGLDVVTVSANITPHLEYGIGTWTNDEIKTAISQGIRADGRKLARAMGFHYYKNISEQDLNAIVVYLRSLKPFPAEQSD